MVAIVTGVGLGFERSSGWVLGSRGQIGDAAFGRYGENVYINAATGNVMINREDEILVGQGPDDDLWRTYNSQGTYGDDNADNWQMSAARRVVGVTSGTLNQPGSQVTRLDWDGSDTTYNWDATRGAYVCTQGLGPYDTLSLSGTTWTWTDGSTQGKETYDTTNNGRIVSSADTDGNQLTFSYNANGTLSYVTTTDTNGATEQTKLFYVGQTGEVSKIVTTKQDGTTLTRVKYTYDTSNRLKSVTTDLSPDDSSTTDANRVVTSYAYDPTSGLVSQITQTGGAEMDFTYTLVGTTYRVASVTQVDSSTVSTTTSFSYDTVNRVTTITDSKGQVTTLTYDANNQLKKIVYPTLANGDQPTVSFTYDTNGNVLTWKDAEGNKTTYTYDGNGNLASQVDQLGDTVVYTYDTSNNMLTQTSFVDVDPDGTGAGVPTQWQTTRYAYDSYDHLRFVVSALGEVTEYRYYASGDPNGNGNRSMAITYRDAGYSLTGLGQNDPISLTALTSWAQGRDQTNAERTDWTYDIRGCVKSATSYGQRDASGNGVAGQTVVNYVYDQAGLLRSRVTSGIPNSELFSYDGLGRLISSTDLNNATSSYYYTDGQNQLVVTLANGTTETSLYNDAGQLISYVLAGANAPTETTSYTYNNLGQLTMATDANTNSSYYLYDVDGRKVADIAADGKMTEYGYDDTGNLISTVRYDTPVGGTAFTNLVAAKGDVNITSVRPASNAGDLWSWRIYDNANRLAETIDGNGDATVFAYDGMSNLVSTTSYATPIAATLVNGYKSTPPEVLRLPTADAANDRVTRNLYDADGRLAATLDGMGYLTQTIYDAAGEKTDTIAYYTQIVDPATKTSGTLAQLLTAAGTSSYDLHTRHVYDDRGLLKYAIDATMRPCEYNYNAAGELLNKTEYAGSIAAPSSYTVANVAAKIQTAGLAANTDTRKTWMVYDTAGRVAFTIDATGAVVQNCYDSMGYLTKQISFATLDPVTSDRDFTTFSSGWATTHAADTGNRVARTIYDAYHRAVYNVDTLGHVVEHRYDNDNQETLTIQYADTYAVNDSTTQSSLATLIGAIPATAIQTKHVYDADGRVSDTYDGLNVQTHYVYSAAGQMTDTIAAFGTTLAATTHYDYDAAGRVSDVTDPAGSRTHFEYNAFGQVAHKTEAYNTGVATKTDDTYDLDGRLSIETRAAGKAEQTTTDYVYNAFNVTSRVDGANDSSVATTTFYVYDTAARLSTETKAYGKAEASTTTYAYNAFSQISSRVDASNAGTIATTTNFLYDLEGRLASQTRAAGTADTSTTAYAYNAFGEVTDRTDAAGTGIATITHYTYDTAGRTLSESRAYQDPEQTTTSYTYDAFDNVLTQIDASNISVLATTTLNAYDLENHLKSQTRASGKPEALQTTYDYDALGRVTDKTVAANVTGDASKTQYDYYDLSNRVTYETQAIGTPDATQTYYQYDALGRVTDRTDANGTGDATITHFEYDALSRVLTESRAYQATEQSTTTYAYNALSQVTDKTVASNVTLDAAKTHYTYDFAGHMVTEVDAYTQAGTTTTLYVYDALDRLITKKAASGTGDEAITSYTYNFASKLSTEIDAQGTSAASTTTYTYDALDDMLTRVQGINSATYTYDGLGEVTSIVRAIATGSSTETDYTYDALGNLLLTKEDANTATPRSTYSFFNALNEVVLQLDAERFWTSYTYNTRGDLTAVTRGFAPYTGTITPGSLPSVTTNLTEDATTTFTRDRLGRLKSVKDAMGNIESYTLNDLGERVTVTNKLGGVTTNTYDKLGRLTSEATQIIYANSDNVQHTTTVTNTYQYDARGNRIQMVEAAGTSDARTTNYAYDKLDRLTATTHDAVYIVDPLTLLTSSSKVTPTETLKYDLRGNVIESDDADGARTLFYYDDLNRKVAELNALGILSTWTYDTTGNVTDQKVYETPFNMSTMTGGGGQPAAPGGNYRETSYTYDRLNRLLTTTVASLLTGQYGTSSYSTSTGNVTITNTYRAGFSQIVQQTDGRNNSVYFYYDNLGRKTAELDQEGYLTTYALDPDGNVKTETRYATKYTGAVSTASPPNVTGSADDRITNFTYDRNGQRLTEQRTGVAYYTINTTTGALTAVTNGTSTVTYTYNALGEVTRKTEATNDYTAYTYDNAGRQTVVTDSSFTDYNGTTVSAVTDQYYNGLNNLTSSVDRGDGTASNPDRTTLYTYGLGGRLASTTDASSFTTTYGYDAAGQTLMSKYSRLLSDGTTSVTEAQATRYDLLGRAVFQSVATLNTSTGVWSFGDQTQTQYDAYGEVAARGVNGGNQETYTYDSGGRMWKSTASDGTVKLYVYDPNGDQTLVISSSGAAPAGYSWSTVTISQALTLLTTNGSTIDAPTVAGMDVTINVFDKRGQNVQVREPMRQLDSATTATITQGRAYNAFGEVKQETDARLYATNFVYNTMGKLISQINPTVNVTDEHGATTSAQPTSYSFFDVSGRLIGTQDANGNVNSRTLLAGTGYDGEDVSVLKEFHPDGGIYARAYDVFGDVRKQTNEINVVETLNYDAMDRLTSEQHANGTTDSYVYDGLGRRTQHWTTGNGAYGTAAKDLTDYDAQGRVAKVVDMGGNTTTYSYAWNGAMITTGLGTFGGWVETTTNAANLTETDKLDYFGRETAKTDFGGHVFAYSYNAAGELTNRTNNQGENVVLAYYNTGLQSSQTSGTMVSTYKYDAAGNRTFEGYKNGATSLEAATVVWDAMDRMTSLSDTGDQGNAPISTAYAYDLNGNIRHMLAQYDGLDSQGNVIHTAITQDYWYKYDSMNRFTTSKGTLSGTAGAPTTTIVRGTGDGMDIAYNDAGQRVAVTTSTSNSWVDHEDNGVDTTYTYTDNAMESYTYTDGYLTRVNITHQYDGVSPGGDYTYTAATYARDGLGRVTDYIEYKDGTTNIAYERQASYDAKSQVTTDTTWTYRSDGVYKTVSNYFYNADANADGNWTNDPTAYQGGAITHIVAYNYLNGNWLQESDTANIYTWWDSAETSIQKYVPDAEHWSQNTSTYTYDASGNLSSVAIADGRPRTVSFINSADGLVLQRDEADNQTGGDPRELHYYFDGIQVGDVSNNGTSDIDYAASIVEHVKTQGTGAFRDGGASVSYADFDQSYDPINGLNYAGTASHYTVQGGDTLQTIAQQIWGDSSFWYLIADANGLNGTEDLTAGTDLIIPNKVGNIHNNTDTFRPYDPNEALGNVSPTAPPKHHASPCGVFGMILLTVIAIAVAIWSAGALAGPMADFAGTTLGFSGATVDAATGAVAITAGSNAAIAGGIMSAAVGGMAGSIVSQGVGVATGIQKSFNWGAVAMAGIGAAVGGALGPGGAFGSDGAFSSLGEVGGAIARGALGNAITQGIGVATGLQKKFDWAGVAAAGVMAGVTTFVSDQMPSAAVHAGDTLPDGSIAAQNIPASQINMAVSGMAGMLTGAATRSLANGSDFGDNIMAMLPDAIGQTIGGWMAGIMEKAPPQQDGQNPATPISGVASDADANPGEMAVDGGLTGATDPVVPVEVHDLPPVNSDEDGSVGDGTLSWLDSLNAQIGGGAVPAFLKTSETDALLRATGSPWMKWLAGAGIAGDAMLLTDLDNQHDKQVLADIISKYHLNPGDIRDVNAAAVYGFLNYNAGTIFEGNINLDPSHNLTAQLIAVMDTERAQPGIYVAANMGNADATKTLQGVIDAAESYSGDASIESLRISHPELLATALPQVYAQGAPANRERTAVPIGAPMNLDNKDPSRNYPWAFGQRRADPTFSSKDDVPPILRGLSLDEAADMIENGDISPDVIQIRYYVDDENKLRVALNTRGLAVLGMAGVSPTNTVLVPFGQLTRAETDRLNEVPIIPSPIPGPLVPITPNMSNLTIMNIPGTNVPWIVHAPPG